MKPSATTAASAGTSGAIVPRCRGQKLRAARGRMRPPSRAGGVGGEAVVRAVGGRGDRAIGPIARWVRDVFYSIFER